MKKILAFILFISNDLHTEINLPNPYTKFKQGCDYIFRNIAGYMPISDLYHPHTAKYIKDLKSKYPTELKDTAFYILPSANSPCATFQSIYFPVNYIERLEKEGQEKNLNGLYSEATEWVTLHEAGHIKYNDVTVKAAAAMLVLPFKQTLKYNGTEGLKKVVQTTNPKALLTLAGMYGTMQVWNLWKEYRADKYATTHCQDPKATTAGYEYVARLAPAGILPGLVHSFREFRLKRIEQQFKEKFNQELVKTYHDQQRVTA